MELPKLKMRIRHIHQKLELVPFRQRKQLPRYVTVAEILDGAGECLVMGVARCHHKDKPVRAVGVALATERAQEELLKKYGMVYWDSRSRKKSFTYMDFSEAEARVAALMGAAAPQFDKEQVPTYVMGEGRYALAYATNPDGRFRLVLAEPRDGKPFPMDAELDNKALEKCRQLQNWEFTSVDAMARFLASIAEGLRLYVQDNEAQRRKRKANLYMRMYGGREDGPGFPTGRKA